MKHTAIIVIALCMGGAKEPKPKIEDLQYEVRQMRVELVRMEERLAEHKAMILTILKNPAAASQVYNRASQAAQPVDAQVIADEIARQHELDRMAEYERDMDRKRSEQERELKDFSTNPWR